MTQGRTPADRPQSRTTHTPSSVPPTESGTQRNSESRDPQLRKIHEVAGSDDELGRGNDVPVEEGGARHRQK